MVQPGEVVACLGDSVGDAEQSGHQGAQALLVMPVTAQRVTQRAPARAWTRESPKRWRELSAVRYGGVCDPLEDWIRKDTARLTCSACNTRCLSHVPWLAVVEVVQAALAAQVVGGVDYGLDPQRAPVFQVLLDAGVLVEGVDGDLGAAGDDLGLELADGGALSAADLAVEEDLDGVRAAEVKVVGDQGFKEPRAWRGASNTRVRETSTWPHGQLPPVTRVGGRPG